MLIMYEVVFTTEGYKLLNSSQGGYSSSALWWGKVGLEKEDMFDE